MATKLLVDSGNIIINRIVVDGEFTPDEGYTVHDDNGQAIGATYDAGYTPQPAAPNTVYTITGPTVAAPAGVTVNLPDQSLPVTYTWDGTEWVADLAALRTARLALIRAHRDTVVEFSDRNAKDSVTLDSPDLTLAKQVGGWTTKLRNMPDVAAPALDALTTAAEIATYAPDYTVPERVIVLSVRRFMAALALTGFITEAEARDRASIPAAIDSVFASLPTSPCDVGYHGKCCSQRPANPRYYCQRVYQPSHRQSINSSRS
jgi:hypothetical protein